MEILALENEQTVTRVLIKKTPMGAMIRSYDQWTLAEWVWGLQGVLWGPWASSCFTGPKTGNQDSSAGWERERDAGESSRLRLPPNSFLGTLLGVGRQEQLSPIPSLHRPLT